jgi:endonuclease YncB( thermonuclease family)
MLPAIPLTWFLLIMGCLILFHTGWDALGIIAVGCMAWHWLPVLWRRVRPSVGRMLAKVRARTRASVRPAPVARPTVATQAAAPVRTARPAPLGKGEILRGVRTRVVDGDSVELLTNTGRKVHVRLFGVDAPEHGCPGAQRAAFILNELLLEGGKPLTVTIQSLGADCYQRTLAMLYAGDRCVNAALVLRGGAWASQDMPAYQTHEAKARSIGLGIWQMGADAVPPWEVRRQRQVSQRLV